MAKLNFVKKCRKDYPEYDIKKGDSYYWWQFRNSPKMKSKIRPKRSQLTQSSFLGQIYDILDSDYFPEETSIKNLEELRDNLITLLEELKDKCEESLDNMPEHLQDSSSTGELLQERIDNLEDWMSNLESVDFELDEELDEEEKKDIIEDIRIELIECNQYF